jgi:dTDP-4-amino-4,6-dideoxygalactose transaminase
MSTLPTFSSWPLFSNEEIDAVKKVLLSNKVNYWTGHETRNFENEFSKWCGTTYAVAVANGTVALDLALKALGIKEGDEVIVSPRSFIASVSCVINAGATPIFSEIDYRSGNITAKHIAQVITKKTKAIICVHLAGWPCDMDPIMAIAQKNKIKVIEDCAQAHGAKYKGKSVGSIGHIGAWSFCQDKIITTGGEGGMVTTNSHQLWKKMWSYKDHGKNFDIANNNDHSHTFKWSHDHFGTNWRMLEIQAALGRIQLKKIDSWTKKRQLNAGRILRSAAKFKSIKFNTFNCDQEKCSEQCSIKSRCIHAYYKCYIYIDPSKLKDGWTRNKILGEINKQGVPCYQGTCPEIYLEKAFDRTNFKPKLRLEQAKILGETSLMFLVHPTLTNEEINKTCHVLENVFKNATE